MESILPIIIVIISMVVSVASSARKEKEKHAAEVRRRESAQRRLEARELLQKQPSASAAPAAIPGMPHEARMAAVPLAPVIPAAPTVSVAPTVHAHVQPDCDIHDAPGSLGETSLEGKDPCHEDQLTHGRTESGEARAASGLTFDWTGENLVKAIVMQEILTRPGQRRAR